MISRSAEITNLHECLAKTLKDIRLRKRTQQSLRYVIQKRLNESVDSYSEELGETYDILAHFKAPKSEKKILEDL